MSRIYDVRGTHGSGKSTLVHKIVHESEGQHVLASVEGKETHIGYQVEEYDAFVLGKYHNVCGGCDGIGKADEICRRVRWGAKKYDRVILEGILVSHTYSRYHQLAEELEADGHEYVFFFLDTPLNVCVRRVRARRLEQGNTKPFNPKNLVHDWKQIWKRVRSRMEEAGHKVVVLPWQDPWSTLKPWLEKPVNP